MLTFIVKIIRNIHEGMCSEGTANFEYNIYLN